MEVTARGTGTTGSNLITIPNDGSVYAIAVTSRKYAYQTGSYPTDWGDIGATLDYIALTVLQKKEGTVSYIYDLGCSQTTEYARYENAVLYMFGVSPGTKTLRVTNTTRYNYFVIKDAVDNYDIDLPNYPTESLKYSYVVPSDGVLISCTDVYKAGGSAPSSLHFGNSVVNPYQTLGYPGYDKAVTSSDYEQQMTWTYTTNEQAHPAIGVYFFEKPETKIPLFAFFGGRG